MQEELILDRSDPNYREFSKIFQAFKVGLVGLRSLCLVNVQAAGIQVIFIDQRDNATSYGIVDC